MTTATTTTAPASTTASTTQTNTQQAAPVAATQQAQANKTAESPRMMKLKVDGQEMELSESEVISLAQQGKSAGKRFQEAAQAKKQAEDLVGYLKSNPKEAFKKLGIDVRKFSEDTLLEMIQQEAMTPEQKKAYDNEQLLKKYQADDKAAKDKAKRDQDMALEQRFMKEYDDKFVEALKESGLSRTPYTVMRMAQLEKINLSKKLNLNASQLAKLVREDYIAEQKALFGQADGDALMELLGKEGVKKLSKAQLAKYKGAKTNNSTPPSRQEPRDPASNPIKAWKEMQRKTRLLR